MSDLFDKVIYAYNQMFEDSFIVNVMIALAIGYSLIVIIKVIKNVGV